MGKRKRSSRKPPPKPKAPKLQTIFDCPFCGHEKCVEALLERRAGIGVVRCRVCDAQHSTKIHVLEEAVDVYAAWIDETIKANQERNADDLNDELETEQHTRERPTKRLSTGREDDDQIERGGDSIGEVDDVDADPEG